MEVGGLLRFGDALRHVASAGSLRLIYEVPRDAGRRRLARGETGEAQLVEDVRSDPDYLASDACVLSEIAYPIDVAGTRSWQSSTSSSRIVSSRPRRPMPFGPRRPGSKAELAA